MRHLSIDLGDVRIGLAMSDSMGIIANGLETYQRKFIYKDRYFFDYGHIASLPVNKIAYMLLGFKVTRVSVELFTLVASVLSSAILGLFFVS